MAGFQTQVNTDPNPAVEGDFCSANPRSSMLAGPGGLVAGAAGVVVGRFARARNSDGQVFNADPGVASRIGFVHRDQLALITGWLAQASMTVQAGLEVTLFDAGDFWARFVGGAAIGQKVFASYLDGSAVAGAAGGSVAGAVVTASAGAAFTASIAANILTVSAISAGVLHVGDVIATGASAGTTITALGTGTGGVGTYTVNNAQTVASTAMTSTSTQLEVTAVTSGTLAVGQPLTGTNVTAGSSIVAATGTGGVGRYTLSAGQNFASTAVTAGGGLETPWYVHSACLSGELAKISTRRVN